MSNVAMYEELEAGINVMLMCDTAAGRRRQKNNQRFRVTVREMLAIAAELRQMPRAEFRTRLATELKWQAGRMANHPPRVFDRKANIAIPRLRELLSCEQGRMFPMRGRSMATSVALHAVCHPRI